MLRAYVLSLPMLFLLKIAVPPFLVAAMSLAARWWGPTIGGLLLGMPWMTGPVLFFLALDKGEDFAVGACAGIELGVVCVAMSDIVFAYSRLAFPEMLQLACLTASIALEVRPGHRAVLSALTVTSQ